MPTAGDLALARLVQNSVLLLIGCVALGKSLNLSESPFMVEAMMAATFLGFCKNNLRPFANVSGLLSLQFEEWAVRAVSVTYEPALGIQKHLVMETDPRRDVQPGCSCGLLPHLSPRCSKQRSDIVLSLRPWLHLVTQTGAKSQCCLPLAVSLPVSGILVGARPSASASGPAALGPSYLGPHCLLGT